jgi:hypothetical protein
MTSITGAAVQQSSISARRRSAAFATTSMRLPGAESARSASWMPLPAVAVWLCRASSSGSSGNAWLSSSQVPQ